MTIRRGGQPHGRYIVVVGAWRLCWRAFRAMRHAHALFGIVRGWGFSGPSSLEHSPTSRAGVRRGGDVRRVTLSSLIFHSTACRHQQAIEQSTSLQRGTSITCRGLIDALFILEGHLSHLRRRSADAAYSIDICVKEERHFDHCLAISCLVGVFWRRWHFVISLGIIPIITSYRRGAR